jgi:hypothetical protein
MNSFIRFLAVGVIAMSLMCLGLINVPFGFGIMIAASVHILMGSRRQ